MANHNAKMIWTICLLLIQSQAGFAYNGKFPGQGSYKDWKRANAIFLKGQIEERKENKAKALGLYELAIKEYDQDADFFLMASMLYQDELHDYDKAEALMHKALELAPDDIQINMAWASLLSEEGKVPQATAALKRAHELIEAAKSQVDNK